jgi:hypothetical protein
VTLDDGPVELIERRRGKRRTAEVRAFGRRIASVVPGTAVSVLATSGGEYGKRSVSMGYVLLDATFADSRTRSVRLLSLDYYWAGHGKVVRRMVREFPAPVAPVASGAVAVSVGGAVAMVDGDVVRIWDPEARTVALPGARDVVLADQLGHTPGTPVLFATGGTGAMQQLQLGKRTLK